VAASVLGPIGDVPVGLCWLGLFDRHRVDATALQQDPLRPTRVARFEREEDGGLRFADFRGEQGLGFADAAVVPATLAESVKPLLGAARWLLVSTTALASGPIGEVLRRCWWRSPAAACAGAWGAAIRWDMREAFMAALLGGLCRHP
jgi:sugar/nucleoside kinase (ribokinase family)